MNGKEFKVGGKIRRNWEETFDLRSLRPPYLLGTHTYIVSLFVTFERVKNLLPLNRAN